MTFTASNTVEQIILNAAAKLGGMPVFMVREDASPYEGDSLDAELRPARWAIRAKVAASKEAATH